jgi:hypothetical protein
MRTGRRWTIFVTLPVQWRHRLMWWKEFLVSKSEGPVAEADGKLEGSGGREHRSLISEDSGNSWQSPVLGCR